MKKIFILTGEPSGDKLASKVIYQLKSLKLDIEYLSVGGEHLRSLGIKSIYSLEDITFLGFTKVLVNIFKIKRKINETVEKIVEFNPDILFSVDSPDFTLRVAQKVKERNSRIKTIHYVAPQVWVWRKNRVKKIKKFIDHMLVLFHFEKKYFEEENIKSTFVGHPLIEKENNNNKISSNNDTDKKKRIISIFPGSRLSEIKVLMPILINFIKMCDKKYDDLMFVFHTTYSFKKLVQNYLINSNIKNSNVVSEEASKKSILSQSVFAVAKSGTVSLEICNASIPSIILYKMNFINFLIIKLLVNVKFANIINIISNYEVIPELIQSNCNPKNIYTKFNLFINDDNLRKQQVAEYQKVLKDLRLNISSSKMVSEILHKNLY